MKKQQGKDGMRGKGSGSIDAFIGLLSTETKKTATIEEMEEAIEQGWGAKEQESHYSPSCGTDNSR